MLADQESSQVSREVTMCNKFDDGGCDRQSSDDLDLL